MTGGWLLTNNSNKISDCTGGHGMMQFDTASQNQIYASQGDEKIILRYRED